MIIVSANPANGFVNLDKIQFAYFTDYSSDESEKIYYITFQFNKEEIWTWSYSSEHDRNLDYLKILQNI